MRKSHIAFFISLALYATLFLAFMQTKLIFTVAGLSTVALSAFILVYTFYTFGNRFIYR